MTLSDIQVQYQNLERDATLKQLQQDMKEMKGYKTSADDDTGTQKAKKCKKSPCGLSVSINQFCFVTKWCVGMCTQGLCILQ